MSEVITGTLRRVRTGLFGEAVAQVMCDGWGEDGEDETCLACARDAHAIRCGCDADGWQR